MTLTHLVINKDKVKVYLRQKHISCALLKVQRFSFTVLGRFMCKNPTFAVCRLSEHGQPAVAAAGDHVAHLRPRV